MAIRDTTGRQMEDMGTVLLIWGVIDFIMFLIVLAVKKPVTAELFVSALIACFLLGPIGFIIILISWKPDKPAPKAVTTSSLDKANPFFGSKPKPQPLPTQAKPQGMPFGQAFGIAVVVAGVFVVGLFFLSDYLSKNAVETASSTGTYEEIQKLKEESLRRLQKPRDEGLRISAELADPTGQIWQTRIKAVNIVNMGDHPVNIKKVVINGDTKCAATREELQRQVGTFTGDRKDIKSTQDLQNMGLALLLTMAPQAYPSLPIELGVGGNVRIANLCGEVVTAVITTDNGELPYHWND